MPNNQPKHVPQRMCVGCRQMKDKNLLVRVVVVDGKPVVDSSQKVQARGVYLCKDSACFTRAAKNKGFAKQHGFVVDNDLLIQLEKTLES